jgi:hypothetical protein
MIDFIVARARALAAAGRGHADREALTRCRDIARTWNLPDYLTALDAALADAA